MRNVFSANLFSFEFGVPFPLGIQLYLQPIFDESYYSLGTRELDT